MCIMVAPKSSDGLSLRYLKTCLSASFRSSPQTVIFCIFVAYTDQSEMDAVGTELRCDLAEERKKNALADEKHAKELAALREDHQLEVT